MESLPRNNALAAQLAATSQMTWMASASSLAQIAQLVLAGCGARKSHRWSRLPVPRSSYLINPVGLTHIYSCCHLCNQASLSLSTLAPSRRAAGALSRPRPGSSGLLGRDLVGLPVATSKTKPRSVCLVTNRLTSMRRSDGRRPRRSVQRGTTQATRIGS